MRVLQAFSGFQKGSARFFHLQKKACWNCCGPRLQLAYNIRGFGVQGWRIEGEVAESGKV